MSRLHWIVVALMSASWMACGASQDGEGGAAGTMQTGGAGGAGGAGAGAAGAAAAGGTGGTGGGSATQPDLFSDPSVPDCMSGPSWQLTGTIGTESVMLDDSTGFYSSNISDGKLHVIGFDPNASFTVGDDFDPLILTWEGSVMTRGTVKELTGNRFLWPADDPAVLNGYCITGGDIGPTTLEPGVLFKFRVRSVRRYENGACTGEEQAAALRGCMLRDNDYLP